MHQPLRTLLFATALPSLMLVAGLPAHAAATVLHSFSNGDGNEPTFTLLAPDKTLYGVTILGGGGVDSVGRGVLYKVDATGNFSILHAFTDVPDGSLPGRMVLGS